MKRKLSLAGRAFLFAFFPICLTLGASFITMNATIRSKIKQGLKESLRRTERTLDKANADYTQRNIQLLAILSKNAGLKAGVGLLREVPSGTKPRPEVLKNIEDQLRDVGGVLDYDLLTLADAEGKPIAAFVGKRIEDAPLDSISTTVDLFPFISVGGMLFEATTVPINPGGENLGSLTLGKKFDIASLNNSGYAALVHDHKVILTNFPPVMVGEVESQLQTQCASGTDVCEIRAGKEDYLTLRLERANLGHSVQLFTFQSIDAAMNELTVGFTEDFLLVGMGGLLMVLLFTAISSRSLSKPLRDLIANFSESERTGRLRSDHSIQSPVKEVNQLAQAFNRAAEAIEESQGRLEEATLQFIETMAQALDARDAYTAGHSNRVSVNSTTIAEAMGLSPKEVAIIRIGAKLHDIGKIGIPDAVLQKPGRLTNEEYALIKLHPQIGKKILENVGRFQEYLPIVELHHEDYNGGGYPYGLKGQDVPLGVRIVHVADVFDAITSDRAYRKAMSEEQVQELLMQGSGTMFDPVVLDVFLAIIRERKALQQMLNQAAMVTTPTPAI